VYPLAWPIGWGRSEHRYRSQFGKSSARKPSVAQGCDDLETELDMLGAQLTVISTNIRPTLSRRPQAGTAAASDPGAAVYFTLDGEDRVLACDRWDLVGCNLRAIAKHVAAMRGMARWGVGSVEQAFSGYTALPETTGHIDWRRVLCVAPDDVLSEELIRMAHRSLALTRHPDRGGSDAQMATLNLARDLALAEIGAG
jgi:hypothetical protein